MRCQEPAAWLLVAILALLPEQFVALREREGAGFKLRSPKAKLQEAFHNLRLSFEKSHPEYHKEAELSTLTKSVTPPPSILGEEAYLQLSHHKKFKRQPSILNGTDDILFSVWTDSKFYDTRLTGILQTWGKEIPPERFMAVSDKKLSSIAPGGCAMDPSAPGCNVEETQCPPHSHWEGACCKWAEGVIKAHDRMERNPALKWAFFSDDDVYLRPGAVANALHEHDREQDPVQPQALGIFGCNTPTGCSGLCGGGGFAINRAAVERLASKDPATFLNEEMKYCSKCQRWADQAISMIWQDKGIEMKPLPGLNGWIMKENDFKHALVDGNPNLLFHYLPHKNQLEAMHEMFTGEKVLSKHDGPCWDYEGRKTCAASNYAEDIPFIHDEPSSGVGSLVR